MKLKLIGSVTLLAMLLVGCNRRNEQSFRLAPPSQPAAANGPANAAAGNPAPGISYADVVAKVQPAVVTIHSQMRVRQPQQFPFMDDPFFRRFFGERTQQAPPAEQTRQALGSGVIVSQDGYIITNHHVIDGAEQIKVDLSDGRSVDAKLVGSDPPSDLALLKISQSGLASLTPGDSDKVRIGDVALAIGNPLGIGQTVTMGIISAKGRTNPAGSLGSGHLADFLQTDAPINHGNSGGALINTMGELIGINSQIVPGNGGASIGDRKSTRLN